MDAYLLIDFGSTYTKLTAVDIQNEEILATARDITTVESGIMVGFGKAFAKLTDTLDKKFPGHRVDYIKKLACSSAAGGLKMVAIGLVAELTAEAAKRAALGAGARVIKIYDHDLTRRDLKEIQEIKPDMILLAGGTDGGNKDCIIHNAQMLAGAIQSIPIVAAGNKTALDAIEEAFEGAGLFYKITENVMPKLNVLNVEPAREEIRQLFMERIIEAKGMSQAEDMLDGILMPTPAAVLKAAQLLSVGTKKEEGLGDLMVVDIGGATTDIHSIADGEPTKPGVTLRGLEEPFAKRTVEGDLGMRYSALSLYEACGDRRLQKYLDSDVFPETFSIEDACRLRSEDVEMLPETEMERAFDVAIAKMAVEISLARHAGILEVLYSPMGVSYAQVGKDLTQIKHVLGTGGVLVDNACAGEILSAGLFDEADPTCLKPQNPGFLLDRSYILSAMGLLAEDYPDKALRIMKKHMAVIG